MKLDHLALSAGTLAEGAAMVEGALGIALSPGGRHAHMGTHNLLLSLGDIYLEVIAADPAAPPPAWPRWFDLDRFTGPPRLTNWIAATGDLAAEVAAGPDGIGTPVALGRGDLRWRMAVPATGRLPFDDAFPALIEWQGDAHPLQRLPDSGLRLTRLMIATPHHESLAAALAGRIDDPRVAILPGPQRSLRAEIATPRGPVTL
jgi:hypothetical protein